MYECFTNFLIKVPNYSANVNNIKVCDALIKTIDSWLVGATEDKEIPAHVYFQIEELTNQKYFVVEQGRPKLICDTKQYFDLTNGQLVSVINGKVVSLSGAQGNEGLYVKHSSEKKCYTNLIDGLEVKVGDLNDSTSFVCSLARVFHVRGSPVATTSPMPTSSALGSRGGGSTVATGSSITTANENKVVTLTRVAKNKLCYMIRLRQYFLEMKIKMDSTNEKILFISQLSISSFALLFSVIAFIYATGKIE